MLKVRERKKGKIMCYYIGIEDLAANALIEIMQLKNEQSLSRYTVTLRELEEYGAEVVRYLNKKKGEKALLILSRASTTHMFKNYSEFFEEIETEDGIAIALQKGKTVESLIEKFRTYIAIDLMCAFRNKKAVSLLNGTVGN